MTEQITLYTAKICPYAQRVEMALKETKIRYRRCEIDLMNKPEWYAREVNPAGKVPAITYGGPIVPPEQPSPASTKLAESLVLVEFIADLAQPHTTILPHDAVGRAKARFFVDMVTNKLLPTWYGAFMHGKDGGSLESVVKALEELQRMLPADADADGEYVMGKEFTIADIAVAPALGRMWVALEGDFGRYSAGEGRKVYEMLKGEEKYARMRRYVDKILERESFKSTFDAEYVKEVMKNRISRQ